MSSVIDLICLLLCSRKGTLGTGNESSFSKLQFQGFALKVISLKLMLIYGLERGGGFIN